MTRGGWPPPAQDTLPTEIQPLQAGRSRTPRVTQKGQVLYHAYIAHNDLPEVHALQTLFPEDWREAPMTVGKLAADG